ncbi:MAG TPA: hypothetical protein VNW54_04910 [Granulicella sp.]|jgi:hypothetical protein|nr:hypothetical protein [Granulicella sp.]
MSDLELQQRELSKDQFESFIHQLLMAKYPGAEIKRVDGAGGDEGIDSFLGLLRVGAAIWQSKHFSGRIKIAQKKQILKSIKAAFTNRNPALWTLCLPINHAVLLSPDATRKAYLAAEDGDTVPWELNCKGPCRLFSGNPSQAAGATLAPTR